MFFVFQTGTNSRDLECLLLTVEPGMPSHLQQSSCLCAQMLELHSRAPQADQTHDLYVSN